MCLRKGSHVGGSPWVWHGSMTRSRRGSRRLAHFALKRASRESHVAPWHNFSDSAPDRFANSYPPRHVLSLLISLLDHAMPPGPAYNWLCVASSLVDILSHSAQVRAAQLARNGAALGTDNLSRKRKRTGAYPDANHSATVVVKSALTAAEDASLVQERNSVPPPCDIPPDVTLPKEQTVPATADAFEVSACSPEPGEGGFDALSLVQVSKTSRECKTVDFSG